MVRSFACACPPPSGSLCSQRRTLSAVLPLSDGRRPLEIGQEVHRTISGPKKPVGFFTATGRQHLGVKNHRSRHSRFGGIPKGSPFGDSLPHLSGQSERWAPGGPGPPGSLSSQRPRSVAAVPLSRSGGAWLRPLVRTARDGQKKPPHKQRAAKNRRFFDGHGEALPGVENHRRTQSRFGGIPKGSPFGDSLPHLSGQSERWAPGGRRRYAAEKGPGGARPPSR